MGMAASQARFLGLTARKTNVEYEGQQINQQRTTLSNQTASYYTNLLAMNVPQPPSVQDYTKTIYSFTDGALTNQLTSMIARNDGSYTISYIREYMDDNAIVAATPSRVVNKGDDTYSVGGTTLRELDDWTGVIFTGANDEKLTLKDGKYYYENTETLYENEVKVSFDDEKEALTDYLKGLSAEQLKGLSEEESHYAKALNADYSKDGNDTWLVRYVKNTSTGAYVPTYYNKSVLAGATYDKTNTSVSYIGAYTRGSAPVNEEIKGIEAFLEQDSTGRYINISMTDALGNMTTYALTTATVKDEDAYKDAMNQYEYDKAKYDKDIQEINAKIEVIQCEDKDLELRLKQLDTEQNAISNEIEAVNKVIEKNVESSFKTFG